ncbi:DUF7344 domain-containing protein [Natronorubrum tibetense]|uniref:DUF7344 domain-containing protein n=1 Tax=Natronorubrum tibetense GA33 TaxID=1114856 RepID=L9VXX6_9EURY|nr:hypothetical protein [Natronorubrum tibetense]ELY42009.1 hypothetical protein C496_08144 [Natronorubrum tibetense GA33]
MTSISNQYRCRADDPADSVTSDRSSPLSRDDIFHVLQTNRRRDAIAYLLNRDGPVKMSDVAEYVAAKENETTVASLTSAQRQRVYIPLYQSHLPKLDKKGIVEYDQSRGIVRSTDRIEIFRPYLEDMTDSDDHSSRDAPRSIVASVVGDYHVTSACASTGLLVATMAGLLQIPELTLAVLIVGLFTLATVATTITDSLASNDAIDGRPVH